MFLPRSALILWMALLLPGSLAFAQEVAPPAAASGFQERAVKAAALARTGRLKEAAVQYHDLVLDAMRALGAEDPAALDLRIAEIRVLTVLGRYADAEEKARNLHRVLVRVVGPDQGATMLIWRTIGQCQAGQGHYDSAKRVYATIEDVLQRAKKESHADMVRVRIAQADVLLAQGDYAAAGEDLRAQLAPAERLLGPFYPETLALYGDLATCAKELGNIKEAISLLTHAYDLALKKLGADHMDTKKYAAQLKELGADPAKKAVTSEARLLGFVGNGNTFVPAKAHNFNR